jgi:ribosomal protein S18 acetylase RimI-like enzyme
MVGGVVAGCCFYEWEPSGSIYLCLILVGPEYRGMGLASALYDAVEGLARDHHTSVLLRTWSDNMHQLRLLERRGYVRVRELLHDRGEGRHTWYFEKTM